jgi:4-oxalmesaconate hydratase
VAWDDTLTYVEAAGFTEEERALVLGGNARRVYPRLDEQLSRAGR